MKGITGPFGGRVDWAPDFAPNSAGDENVSACTRPHSLLHKETRIDLDFLLGTKASLRTGSAVDSGRFSFKLPLPCPNARNLSSRHHITRATQSHIRSIKSSQWISSGNAETRSRRAGTQWEMGSLSRQRSRQAQNFPRANAAFLTQKMLLSISIPEGLSIPKPVARVSTGARQPLACLCP